MEEINIKKYVGNKIKFYRKQNHLTQKDLGDRIGVKDNTISGYENGISDAGQNVLFAIAEVFGISVNSLFPPTKIDAIGHLSVSESNLIINYRKLNADGQSKVDEYTKDLTGNSQYTFIDEPQDIFNHPEIPMAASGLTSTEELSEHNKSVIAKHYNNKK